LTLTCKLQFLSRATCGVVSGHAQDQGQRSVSLKGRVEIFETDRQTDEGEYISFCAYAVGKYVRTASDTTELREVCVRRTRQWTKL